MFSIVTVASSTRIPTARARPPRVMTLMVSPRAPRTTSEVRMERGMEMAMMRVLRQLPRNSRIIVAVRHAAITGRPHKEGLIGQGLDLQVGGHGGHPRQQRADPAHDVEGRGVSGLL